MSADDVLRVVLPEHDDAEWTAKREDLEQKMLDAVCALINHMGCSAFKMKLPTHPPAVLELTMDETQLKGTVH